MAPAFRCAQCGLRSCAAPGTRELARRTAASHEEPTFTCGRIRSIVSGLLFTMKTATPTCRVASARSAVPFLLTRASTPHSSRCRPHPSTHERRPPYAAARLGAMPPPEFGVAIGTRLPCFEQVRQVANFASFFCNIRRLGWSYEWPPSLLMAAVESGIVASSMTARQGRGGGATESLNPVPLGTDTSQGAVADHA
jgi:hypothetical protein